MFLYIIYIILSLLHHRIYGIISMKKLGFWPFLSFCLLRLSISGFWQFRAFFHSNNQFTFWRNRT